jgi:hypothetical protein
MAEREFSIRVMLVRLDRKTLRCCDLSRNLNEPKCEIFTILDSRYFYTTKSLWVGDFDAGKKSKFISWAS